jgi:hypothetical protein
MNIADLLNASDVMKEVQVRGFGHQRSCVVVSKRIGIEIDGRSEAVGT